MNCEVERRASERQPVVVQPHKEVLTVSDIGVTEL